MSNYYEFDEVYKNNSKLIYHIAFSYLKDVDEAKDIIQDVFMKYLQKKPRIKSQDEIKYWLIRVTINKCISVINYKKKHIVHIDDEIIKNILVDDNKYTEEEEGEKLYKYVCELEPIYKNVIILYYYENLRSKEIAKVLNTNESTIRMRLLRARNILKERMEDYKNERR